MTIQFKELSEGYAFKPDDLARLKSGGPVMTIHHIIGQMHEPPIIVTVDESLRLRGFADGDIVCVWYEGLELKVEPFDAGMLELAQIS